MVFVLTKGQGFTGYHIGWLFSYQCQIYGNKKVLGIQPGRISVRSLAKPCQRRTQDCAGVLSHLPPPKIVVHAPTSASSAMQTTFSFLPN